MIIRDGTVTLLVHGFLVSGTIVSGSEFIKAHGRRFADALQNQFGLSDSDTGLSAHYEKLADAIYENPEKKPGRPGYIHLRDVQFFSQAGQPIRGGQEGVYWRVKLSDVAGFTAGSLSAD